MQFKVISILAAALTVQSTAYAMSSTQQGQAQKQSEQSEQSMQSMQIHQLEDLAQHIQSQQIAQLHQLDIGLPAINASAITTTLNSVANVFATTGAAISNITAVTLAQQLPNIIASISALAGNLITSVSSIITTPVTSTFSLVDQQSIYNALVTLTQANTQLINAFVGPNGLVANSLLRGPIGVVLNLLERTVVNLAGAIIARIPAFAQQAQSQLGSIHASLSLTVAF
ncbi:hypothetical protein TARUN_7389 [Trichoderma arundinaceum]|uniref:Uncharacterized protein n=1 Tax=Trichoderma arundinaceum TaxID=490622 RepID=A0A395NFW1_TRIAR|nr:hypothetical protein TARUN_7389 [Trichoderma arundinaceum]